MKVSVIIPVYNAEKFVVKAVKSALEQKQIGEIILIEDNSNDDSLQQCNELEKKDSRVRLIINRENKGASESRNIGIKAAQYPYIAFLDADDYYLPGYFDMAEKIFNAHPDAEGIFGSIGAHFYDKLSKIKHLERTGREKTGLNLNFDPDKHNLFQILLLPKTGHLSLDGIIIKKFVIDKIGYFDISLIQGQDTDFIWRLSYFAKLYAIDKDVIVAMRGVHSENRVLNLKEQKKYSEILMEKWIRNINKFNLSDDLAWLLFRKYLTVHPLACKYEDIIILRIIFKLLISVKTFTKNPQLFFKLIRYFFNKYFKLYLIIPTATVL